MKRSDPSAHVDLARYPIRDLAAKPARALVAECRRQLAADGCCELSGFVTAEATELMTKESDTLVGGGHTAAGPATVYLELPDPSLPVGHPRRALGRSAVEAIAYDLFPPEHALRRLYEWDGLMEFLAAALDVQQLHRYADPLGALNVAVMRDGDALFWHFDQCDFVTSIALRGAERGGDFEYVPRIRSASDERYPAVQALLEGSPEGVKQVPMTPGTLLLFQGRHSIHRVTAVEGATSRLVALLAYDTKPGTLSSDLLRLARYGRNPAAAP